MIDAYICDSVRAPIGLHGGTPSSIRTDDLAVLPVTDLMARYLSGARDTLGEATPGSVNQPGEDTSPVAWMADLLTKMSIDAVALRGPDLGSVVGTAAPPRALRILHDVRWRQVKDNACTATCPLKESGNPFAQETTATWRIKCQVCAFRR